jgi:hypothetical protein
MINEWWTGKDVEGSGRGLFRYSPGIFLEGLGKTTENFSQDIRSPGLDLKPRPPEYKAELLTTHCVYEVCYNSIHSASNLRLKRI